MHTSSDGQISAAGKEVLLCLPRTNVTAKYAMLLASHYEHSQLTTLPRLVVRNRSSVLPVPLVRKIVLFAEMKGHISSIVEKVKALTDVLYTVVQSRNVQASAEARQKRLAWWKQFSVCKRLWIGYIRYWFVFS